MWVTIPPRNPERFKGRLTGNPVPVGISGPPCHWGHQNKDMALAVGGWTQGWQPCSVKWLLLQNPQTWNPEQVWQYLLRKAVAQKWLFYRWWLLWYYLYIHSKEFESKEIAKHFTMLEKVSEQLDTLIQVDICVRSPVYVNRGTLFGKPVLHIDVSLGFPHGESRVAVSNQGCGVFISI
jgi:hypothetical protein